MKASIRELRTETKAIMAAVKRGDKVIITSHGTDCAQIIPIKQPKKPKEAAEVFGMWEDHDDLTSVKDYVRNLRAGRDVC